MTAQTQKFNASGVSQIDNAIKAMALENLVMNYQPESIVLVSGNDKLALTLQRFCRNSSRHFQWKPVKGPANPVSVARLVYGSLPCTMRAIIAFFRYLFGILPLFRAKQAATAYGEISFVDVLVHLDKKALTTGRFISNYWTALVGRLGQSNCQTNWLHNYFYQDAIPTPVKAQELLGSFNKNASGIQSHILIEANLGASVFIRALKDYLRISIAATHLSRIDRCFTPAGSGLDLWPLFKDEWIDSLRGSNAMMHCLRVSLYEKIFNDLPHQKVGVYIQENQPWEMALIHAWKAAGHGQLIGVPHTTVRFWDLRYFYDYRSYARTAKNPLPIPDLVAVNGPVAKNNYLRGGYPETQIVEVEALRFIHLLNRAAAGASTKSLNNALQVLVCGDFLSSTTNKMLSWLGTAAQSLPAEIRYVLKPHPAYPVKASDFPSLTLEVTEASFAELFLNCDVVFTSNITSAAVDAYCSGIPVIQMLDGNTFNMSPLRGLKGGVYVKNAAELMEALRNIEQRDSAQVEPYFYLDEKLPRWKRLLDLGAECGAGDLD
jgi:surface carbohydrate biosynthesis protein (TIGR04326 family)